MLLPSKFAPFRLTPAEDQITLTVSHYLHFIFLYKTDSKFSTDTAEQLKVILVYFTALPVLNYIASNGGWLTTEEFERIGKEVVLA
jgi:hypothetical protein